MGIDYLPHYRDKLLQTGHDPVVVDRLVERMLAAPGEFEALVPALREAGNALDWYYDRDYAAVALQAAAVHPGDADLRRKLLSLAHQRASWCASCATSGGEGTARSRHVQELEAALAQLVGEVRTGPQIGRGQACLNSGNCCSPGRGTK